jgi:hypothetical protein
MTYEEYLDEVTTLLTEMFDMSDEAAIKHVMRAQAADFLRCTTTFRRCVHKNVRCRTRKHYSDKSANPALSRHPNPSSRASARNNPQRAS